MEINVGFFAYKVVCALISVWVFDYKVECQ